MNPLDRTLDDLTYAMRLAAEAEKEVTHHAWPAIISQDSDGHRAQAKSAIKGVITTTDGVTTQSVDMPVFDMAPVHFPGGGGTDKSKQVFHTHPVKTGDTGVMLVLDANQDNHLAQSGVQIPFDGRRHAMADSRWLPGGRTDPEKIDPPPSTTSQQNRSGDGNHVMDLHPSNGITHSSTTKIAHAVGGGSGSTLTMLASKTFRNAAKYLLNCTAPNVGKTAPATGMSIANNKLIALKTPIASLLSGTGGAQVLALLTSVLSGGASAVLSNPVASAASGASSAASAASAAVTTALGGAGATLATALTTLASTVTAHGTAVASMAGAGTASPSLSDVMTHSANVNAMFGASAPSTVSMATVLAPLQSGPTLTAAGVTATSVAASAIAGSMTVSAATTQIAALSTQIGALVPAASAAISTLNAAMPALQLVMDASHLANSQNPLDVQIAGLIGNANTAIITAALAALFTATPAEAELSASFPDNTVGESPGATGGL